MSLKQALLAASTVQKLLQAGYDFHFLMTSQTGRKRGLRMRSEVTELHSREVEVESIWGETLRAAQSRGVPTPRFEMLYELMRQLTSLRG